MRKSAVTPPIDRARLRKLLGMLGSDHDGEVLSAARRVVELIDASKTSWEVILPDLEAELPGGLGRHAAADRDMIDALLASTKVSDVLKIRLKSMRASLRTGRLGDQDRLYLRILHRKAVIDGVVVEA
jgi:hypothetical protein